MNYTAQISENADYITNEYKHECAKYIDKVECYNASLMKAYVETPEVYRTDLVRGLSQMLCAETESDGITINHLLRKLDEVRFDQLRLLNENEALKQQLRDLKLETMVSDSAIKI